MLLFHRNTNLWPVLFVAIPLLHPLHVLGCAAMECGWGWLSSFGTQHHTISVTWHCKADGKHSTVKLLLLLTQLSSHTACNGGQEGQNSSFTSARESGSRIHVHIHIHIHIYVSFTRTTSLSSSTGGCISWLYYSPKQITWDISLSSWQTFAQKGQCSSSSL